MTTFDPAKHPHRPAGSPQGGQWAPAGFPEGVYDPHASVVFWPKKIAEYSGFGDKSGPFWKALLDVDTGKETAFWFAGEGGRPHHASVLADFRKRGIVGDVPQEFVSGYGKSYFLDPASPVESADVEAMVRRHVRDIVDAQEIIDGQGAVTAAAPPYSPAQFSRSVNASTRIAEAAITGTLADAYERALRSVAADAAVRFKVKAAPLTAAYVEAEHPRDPGGKDGGEWIPKGTSSPGEKYVDEPSPFWKEQDYQWPKAMRDWHTFTKEDVLAGRVPGVVADENVREGVAGHARDKAITVKADSQAAFPNGKLSTYLLSHEAGHYVANEIQREAGRMDIPELHAFDRDGKLRNPWSDEFSPAYTNEPGEALADAYAELLHGEMERAVEDGNVEKQALLQRVARTAKKLGLPAERTWRFQRGPSGDYEAVAAAGGPPEEAKFVPPDPDELVPKDKLAAEIEKRTREIRQQVVAAVVGGLLTQAGIDFTVGGIFSQAILDRVGARVRDADLSTRDAIRTVINQAQDEGWTVPETAAAIKQHITDLAPSTATQLARTDLIGTSNASATAAAKMVFAGRPTVKRWLATEDERTRPTHVEADGQIVPLEGAFNVGGSSMDYPGDPAGPDAEVCNCRCTLLFEDAPSLAAATWHRVVASMWDEAKHPRDPKHTPTGGRFRSRLGVTPYREGHDLPKGFYESERFRRFDEQLAPLAHLYGVTIDGKERVSGFWQGGQEPSVALEVHDGEDGVRQYAHALRERWDQEAVLMFSLDDSGPDVAYSVPVREGDAAEALMAAGIDGATIHGDRVVVIGTAGDADKVAELAGRVGAKPVEVETAAGNLAFIANEG